MNEGKCVCMCVCVCVCLRVSILVSVFVSLCVSVSLCKKKDICVHVLLCVCVSKNEREPTGTPLWAFSLHVSLSRIDLSTETFSPFIPPELSVLVAKIGTRQPQVEFSILRLQGGDRE